MHKLLESLRDCSPLVLRLVGGVIFSVHGYQKVFGGMEKFAGMIETIHLPAYFVDPHGFAEIVLDVPRLRREDLAFAVRIFTLENGGASASLDGRAVELYPSRESKAV